MRSTTGIARPGRSSRRRSGTSSSGSAVPTWSRVSPRIESDARRNSVEVTKLSIATAYVLLEALDAAFDAAVAAVAQRCARHGELDDARLDEHQWSSYELA